MKLGSIETSRVKFRKIMQKDPVAETMERDLDKARMCAPLNI